MTRPPFVAERLTRTASILLHGPIDAAFPLFGPVEEKKWARGWNPTVLYPPSATLEEGMVFTTPAHHQGEADYHWIVARYEPDRHSVTYVVSAPTRIWTITIRCTSARDAETKASITYTFTGIDDAGNALNARTAAAIFGDNLSDWEESINDYLSAQRALTRP
jgi:hypothetical protein